MFTTGSKFFFGAAFVAGFAAFVQGVAVSDPAGMLVLIGVAVIALFLGGVMVASRDAHAGVPASGAASVPGVAHTGPTIWPVAGGLGTALAALGIVVDRRLAGAGIIVLLATVIEWMIQSWSDRSSADIGFNARMRGRVAHPLEFPIFAAILGVGVIYMFSRIMVSLGEKPATVVFAIAGLLVLLGAVTLWKLDHRLSGRAVGAVVAVGALVLGTGAVVGINKGEHAHEHKATEELDGNKRVAHKANTLASVYFADGKVEFRHDAQTLETLEVPRSTTSSLLFHNESAERVILIIENKKVETDAEGNTKVVADDVETDPVSPGASKILVVNFPKSGSYKLRVEPIESGSGAEAEVVVP